MERAVLVYSTFPTEEAALLAGEFLVRDGLAACVNVLPATRSVYRWQGSVARADEATALIKTREGLKDAAAAALKARHPYETPVILFLGPFDGDPGTLDWIARSTEAGAPPSPA